MNITINAIELASELAHDMVCAMLKEDSNAIYQEPTDRITTYTDNAQYMFDEWYDHYLHKIEQCNNK